MRKKMALTIALAISAIFTGSVYSNILYANQYEMFNTPFSYIIMGESTTTYDFSNGASTDKWAYRREDNQNPPSANNVPSVEFNLAQYNRISADDGVRQGERASSGNYAAHRFVFTINESIENITKIDILWNGIGVYAFRLGGSWVPVSGGVTLHIWNYNTSSYETLNVTASMAEGNVTASITSNISNYINGSGKLILLIEQNSASWLIFYSLLATDYIKADVTYTGG